MRAQAATQKSKSGGPLRAMKDVIASEGVAGLYRGLSSTLITLFAANFIYFYAFHFMRAFVTSNTRMRQLGKVLLATSWSCVIALGSPASVFTFTTSFASYLFPLLSKRSASRNNIISSDFYGCLQHVYSFDSPAVTTPHKLLSLNPCVCVSCGINACEDTGLL